MKEIVKIKSIDNITHDVIKIITEKPAGMSFLPGQATELSINKEEWRGELRPFTFTSLPDDDYLEFTIKTYPSHNGLTHQMLSLGRNDELILHDVFGAIEYKGEGLFIAGGAGVTPFIAIFRKLQQENNIGNSKLLFANKTRADIILNKEFSRLLGTNFINVLSEERSAEYEYGFVSEELLRKHAIEGGYYYICGPEPMMQTVHQHLTHLGVSEEFIVTEAF